MNKAWEFYQVADRSGNSAYEPTHDTLEEAKLHYYSLIYETRNSEYPATKDNICVIHVVHSETEMNIE